MENNKEIATKYPKPIIDILLIGFILLGLYITLKGASFVFSSFSGFIVAILYIISINLVFHFFFKNILSEVTFQPGSLMIILRSNRYLRGGFVVLLNVLAGVNFSYAWFHASYLGGPISRAGFVNFGFAIVLSFISYLAYKNNNKQMLEN